MMKIFFLINGLGLGNSTRCHAIIQRLKTRGADIEVVTSGNGLWYFSDKAEVSAVHEIGSLAYGSKDGAISVVRTFASVGRMLAVIRANVRKLSNILDDAQPDAVVTDSDYNFIPVKRRKIPLVALNNADVVWHSYFKFPDRPVSIRAQFFCVEMLDYRFHRLVPDLVLSPSLDPKIEQSGGNVRRIGPIVRQGYNPTQGHRPPKRAVVMLSGSVFGTPVRFERDDYPIHIDVVGREAPSGWSGSSNIIFHGKIKDTYPLLKQADITVVNGGFSAVSEMFWMRKPLVVVPVPNHAEQWINARTIEQLCVGRMARQFNYESVMIDSVNEIERFDAGYAALPLAEDGAAQAADAILDIATRGPGGGQ